MLGSSPQLIVGPDAALCMMIAAALGHTVVAQEADALRYLDLSITLSFLVGIFCLAARVLRLGVLANFLSKPILTGFLNGVGLTIISSQLGKICGISIRTDTGLFLRIIDFLSKFPQVHLPTLIVAIMTFFAIVLAERFAPKIPGALIGVCAGIAIMATLGLDKFGVSALGSVPAGLPFPRLPEDLWNNVVGLLPDAAGVALICFCSSMLTAKSFAVQNGYDVDANQELVALGVANFVSALSRGFVITGADSRTAINNQAGGQTQLSGIAAAVIMALFLAFWPQPFEYIPAASIGAILLIAGLSLLDIKAVQAIYRISRSEFGLSILTTLGVATVGVLPGIALAVAITIILLLVKASNPYDAVLGRPLGESDFTEINEQSEALPVPGVLVYRFDAALLFFNADYFKKRVRQWVQSCTSMPRYFIFDMEAVNAIDVTGIESLEDIRSELVSKQVRFLIARAKPEVFACLSRAGISVQIGAANFYPSIRSAVQGSVGE